MSVKAATLSPERGKSLVPADGPVRTLATNELLFREGDARTCLYLIEAGSICTYRRTADQAPEVVEFAFAGDVVGLGCLAQHIYWARAVVETRVRALPLAMMDEIVTREGRTQQRFAEAVGREFLFRRQLLTTARRDPIGRVAAFFLALSQINKHEGRDGSIIRESLACGAVAECLELDLGSLGRALVELEKKGLIEPCPPLGLRLTNAAGLESLVNESITP
jgi:CRP/FNR family transcriptional regulator